MLHDRLLIGFLNTPLGNTDQKTSKRHFLNHIKHFVSLFLSCTFFYVFFYVLWNKSKNLLRNKMKDLTLKSLISPSLSFLKIISYDGPNIYDIHKERRKFEIYQVFTDSIVFINRSIVHNFMIPNVKKIMFLALVPVLQWNSHPHFFVCVHSKWKVT